MQDKQIRFDSRHFAEDKNELVVSDKQATNNAKFFFNFNCHGAPHFWCPRRLFLIFCIFIRINTESQLLLQLTLTLMRTMHQRLPLLHQKPETGTPPHHAVVLVREVLEPAAPVTVVLPKSAGLRLLKSQHMLQLYVPPVLLMFR